MLSELQNSVLAAVLLVFIVIIGILGMRTALLVGVAIPGSFPDGHPAHWMHSARRST